MFFSIRNGSVQSDFGPNDQGVYWVIGFIIALAVAIAVLTILFLVTQLHWALGPITILTGIAAAVVAFVVFAAAMIMKNGFDA